jgi:hypothetical protein
MCSAFTNLKHNFESSILSIVHERTCNEHCHDILSIFILLQVKAKYIFQFSVNLSHNQLDSFPGSRDKHK